MILNIIKTYHSILKIDAYVLIDKNKKSYFYTAMKHTKSLRKGFVFKTYQAPFQSPFDKLLEVFKELITHTSGDFDEAIDWLRELDKEYQLTTPEYNIDDFIEDLKNKGYIREEIDTDGNVNGMSITAKTERAIRQQALDQIFGNIKRSGQSNHKSKSPGIGDEHTGDFREYQFGDALDKVSMTESLKNAQVNHGINDFSLSEDDFVSNPVFIDIIMGSDFQEILDLVSVVKN